MDKKLKMGVGIGGPSIIMIFVALCLTTLGALSLMTANADWKLTQKAADALTEYYAADNEVEEILASVDADLKAGHPLENDSFVIPISDRQNLAVELKSEGTRYTVLSRKIMPASQWDYDQFKTEFDDSITE
ncbi:hypothetical protein Desde_1673 [Desulfitobacterium dehalogenans ATCC 51507]|uniref:Uncharacterized protein n=1 Tax=Desulfitobacterium dehalogenans (strain ATCC 51507 / DSM 9161 / JW/IU-DC1) TaxID=756499 RepID=I4A7Z1_DESDJ|nr:hypothetical protein [Desulfitobacterium dehalogenans]AFM00076.1 hypothetical protein Desde_1673 [Desulfitobacterium dehalogenans ATCC 51507]